MLIISFICPFFFLSYQIFCYRFLGFYESQSLQISYTPWEWPSILWDRKPRSWGLFLPSFWFPCLLFSIFHSNVIYREICVKDFSGTTELRILKFGTNVGYDLLYCVKENQHSAAYHSFICPFIFLSNKTFCHRILSSYYSQSLQILYRPWEGPSILWESKPRFYD